MRDLTKIAEKMDKLWAGGKFHTVKPTKQAPTTDQAIDKAMAQFQKKGK
jgi:hypothetical protein